MEKEARSKEKTNTPNLEELSSKGAISSLADVTDKENGIILGKITRICPLNKIVNPNHPRSHVQIVILKELLVHSGESRVEFRLITFDEIAAGISSSNLFINDYIAICKPLVSNDSSYSPPDTFHKFQVIYGLRHSDSLENIFVKRAEWEHWVPVSGMASMKSNDNISVLNTNSLHKKRIVDIADLDSGCQKYTYKKYKTIVNTVSSDSGSDSESYCIGGSLIEIQPQSSNVSEESTSNNEGKLETIHNSPMEKQKPSSERVNLFTRAINRPNIILKENSVYLYTKISELRPGTFNVYGIIQKIKKHPSLLNEKRYHAYLYVTDEMGSLLPVHIYYSPTQNSPMLREGYIVRFHRLKVENYGARMDGRVFNSHDVVTFDPNNESVIYSTAKNVSYTDEGQKRLVQIKNFVANFRKLETIKLDTREFNLVCKIIAVKNYSEERKVLLRVGDDTICRVPSCCMVFSYGGYKAAFSRSDILYTNYSDKIDIVVTDPDEAFKKLVEHDVVQLNNISTDVLDSPIAGLRKQRLRFFLNGRKQNLIIHEKDSNIDFMKCDTMIDADNRSIFNSENVIDHCDERNLLEHCSLDEGCGTMMDSEIQETVQSNRLAFNSENVTDLNSDKEDLLEDCLSDEGNVIDASQRTSQESIKYLDVLADKKSSLEYFSNEGANDDKNSSPNDPVLKMTTVSAPTVTSSKLQMVVTTSRNSPSEMIASSASVLISDKSQTTMKSNEVDGYQQNLNNQTKNNKIFHLGSSENIMNKVDIELIQTEETAEMIKKGTTIKYLKKWPSRKLNSSFYIRAYLTSTTPSLDKINDGDNVMSLINIYCSKCRRFYPVLTVKWSYSSTNKPEPTCPKCVLQDNSKAEIKFLLICKLSLEDESGCTKNAIVMDEHAENFFGYTVDELCNERDARNNLKRAMQKYMSKVFSEKILLLFRMVQVKNTINGSYTYYVFDTKLSECVINK